MRDKKIHDMIEDGNIERKNRSWQIIEESIRQDEVNEQQVNGAGTLSIVRSKKFVIVSVAAFAIIFALILFFLLYDFDGAKDDFHFYSNNDYTVSQVDTTLKEYSAQSGANLLYFDWYDVTYYYLDTIYTLNGTDEIICYNETIFDNSSGNMISLFVVSEDVSLDFLEVNESISNLCYQSNVGINVNWSGATDSVYANFRYNGYKYYLRIDEMVGEAEGILSYVEMLVG